MLEWEANAGAWVRRLAYSLLAPEALEQAALDLEPMVGVDAAWASELLDELDESQLADLSIVRFGDEWAVWEPSFRFNPTGAAWPTTRAGFYELTTE